MKKVSLILVAVIALSSLSVFTGCGSSSSDSTDLYDAKSWDYDGDGKLSGRELDGYSDFYSDAYKYAYN